MTGRDYDFEELRPLGEASRTPDQHIDDRSTAAPRRQRNASGETGYPEHSTTDEAECRACGAPIPVSQTKCRFCLSNHLGDTSTAAAESGQESTLVGIRFALVESSTFYGAVAKGAAAGNLLVGSGTESAINGYRLIYDLEGEVASQLADQWPLLQDATEVTSAAGEQLLTAIRERMDGQDCSTFAGAHEPQACLYDERGGALQTEARLNEILETADDSVWLVPGIALRESDEESDRNEQAPSIPTEAQLECHHCNDETGHRFDTYESLPDDTWSGQPIWRCRECGASRHGPEPQ